MLWQSYTNLGVDNRNQIDELRSLPGGIAGLTEVIRQFHAAGVMVLFPWNHWGNSTGHIEPDADFVELLAQMGADGFNTDSGGRPLVYGQKGYTPDPDQYVSRGFDGTSFVKQGLVQHLKFNGHDLLDQPEHGAGCPPDLILGGWAGEGGGPGPGACVECAKLAEPRHLTQWVERDQVMRQPGLKWAFFNGNGYNTWENNWGWWNGISPRDGETMRRVFTIFRAFANVTSSCDFRPFYPYITAAAAAGGTAGGTDGVAATLFPAAVTAGRVLLTVINPEPTGPIGNFTVAFNDSALGLSAGGAAGLKWYDLWNGRAAGVHRAPSTIPATGGGGVGSGSGSVTVTATSRDEYGAVVGVSPEVAGSAAFATLLATMARLSATPISDFSATPGGSLNYTFRVNSKTNGTVPAVNTTGMVAVPETASYIFRYQSQQTCPSLGHGVDPATKIDPVYPVPTSRCVT